MKIRHTKQQRNQMKLLRRSMVQKVKPSSKVYCRNKDKKQVFDY